MLLPLLLLFGAAFASAIVAYGTHPVWAQYSHGLSLILFSRRFEWPLATLAILLCLVVVGLIVAGKRRAWWLIGLGPVLALFVHRYQTDPLRDFAIVDNPAMVEAGQALFMNPDDYVVGLAFEGTAYAYPYFSLYRSPVVFQNYHEKRVVLMWSAFANCARAFRVSHELHPRDLEIISMPANALLLYNIKLGQFINGVTGQTPGGERPVGFLSGIAVYKVRWGQWVGWYPSTRVMVPPAGVGGEKIPNAPLRPWFGHPAVSGELSDDASIVLIETPAPVAIRSESVTTVPANVSSEDAAIPLVVFRDRATGRVRAFDRRVEDLALQFQLNTDPRRKQAFMIDLDTNSGWLADGRAVDGPMAREEKRLRAVGVDEDLYWGVMKTWMPQLRLLREGRQPRSASGPIAPAPVAPAPKSGGKGRGN